MPCKICRQSGHNSKTCIVREINEDTERVVYDSVIKKECIICYEDVGGENGEVTTRCGHKYCTTCFITHMRQKNKCAYCRMEICETPHSSLPLFSEALEERIINECINNEELQIEIKDDVKKRFCEAVELYGGLCTVEIASYIFDNQLSFMYPMAIVSHNVLDIVAESRRRYEEIQGRR
jgi:hypothetical protein